MKYEISFIILTWNSKNYIEKCLLSVIYKCEKEDINFEIIVVDNGSEDGTIEIIEKSKAKYKNRINLIKLRKNMGTTLTRNLALKESKYEFLCILDSDVQLKKGQLREVMNELQENSKIALIAPKILLEDQTVQFSVKKFPTFIQKLENAIKILLKVNFKTEEFYEDFPFGYPQIVESAISACWFLRRTSLKAIGYFDEKIYYSPEDLDYCMRILHQRKAILYYPYFEILHHTQQISHKRPLSKISRSHLWGLIYYFHKHGGWVSRKRIESKFVKSVKSFNL